ncbi:hypothetical protein PMAYCL1PPCAC_16554, partial [Pristionchus mayeri]
LLTSYFRTPAHMQVYSRILAAFALCDMAGVVAMMLSVTREQVLYTAAILEFNGVCAAFGLDFCCVMFGVQEYMYSATCMLLCSSFAYRLRALHRIAATGSAEAAVIGMISAIIAVNFPLIALYHRATTIRDPIIDVYRRDRGLGWDQPI